MRRTGLSAAEPMLAARGAGKSRAVSSCQSVASRIAIVHDWFQGEHGAERTVQVMIEDVFERRADLFTFSAPRELLPPSVADALVRDSALARLPGVRQVGHDRGRWRYLLPYMPLFFRRLDLDDYDVVISSSHSCASHVRPRSDALHVCYCYTPMRYAWMPSTDRHRVGRLGAPALRAASGVLRRLDRAASARPDAYVAISTAVRDRIRRFYGREATVIHPPVDVADLDASSPKDPSFFLWVHRLVPYKNPLVVAEAFRGLPYSLIMVGIGPLEAELRKRLPPNVELRGWLPREQLVGLYASASGFVHVAEEDFGITMVEALASGTPVVALARGGALDIIRDGEHGVFTHSDDVSEVRAAVEEVASRGWDQRALRARAEEFARPKFVAAFRDYLVRLR
jgi:glycosyltransferase involved in cell wall biosynthesis